MVFKGTKKTLFHSISTRGVVYAEIDLRGTHTFYRPISTTFQHSFVFPNKYNVTNHKPTYQKQSSMFRLLVHFIGNFLSNSSNCLKYSFLPFHICSHFCIKHYCFSTNFLNLSLLEMISLWASKILPFETQLLFKHNNSTPPTSLIPFFSIFWWLNRFTNKKYKHLWSNHYNIFMETLYHQDC